MIFQIHFYPAYFQGPSQSSLILNLFKPATRLWAFFFLLLCITAEPHKSSCPCHIHSFNSKPTFIACPLCAKHLAYVISKPHHNPRKQVPSLHFIENNIGQSLANYHGVTMWELKEQGLRCVIYLICALFASLCPQSLAWQTEMHKCSTRGGLKKERMDCLIKTTRSDVPVWNSAVKLLFKSLP